MFRYEPLIRIASFMFTKQFLSTVLSNAMAVSRQTKRIDRSREKGQDGCKSTGTNARLEPTVVFGALHGLLVELIAGLMRAHPGCGERAECPLA